jgi:uncharacterized YigZ family protein
MCYDEFHTLKAKASAETRVKGSRFIGYAAPVENREDAEAFIQSISKKHHDAAHNCYAYRIGFGDNSGFRYSDAGEPSGTAGRPILDAIDGRDLTNTICVVARYFGGTKLGTGGLARAYHDCASSTLDAGTVIVKFVTDSLHIRYPYDLTGVVMKLLSKLGCDIEETIYENEPEMHVRIRLSEIDRFQRELIDATAGKAKIIR